MTAAEFDAMTPREVQGRINAETARDRREFERIAQLACWVINPWLQRGQTLTVPQLLPQKRATRKRPSD